MNEIEGKIGQSASERGSLEGLRADGEHKKEGEEKKVDKPLAKTLKMIYNIIIKLKKKGE